MTKKFAYQCFECGHEETQWYGKCQYCKNWNTLQKIGSIKQSNVNENVPINIDNFECLKSERFYFKNNLLGKNFKRTILKGSISMFFGEPSVGKTFFCLNALKDLSETNNDKKFLYVTTEEFLDQIVYKLKSLNLKSSNAFVLSETNWYDIKDMVLNKQFDLVIIDSIQMLSAGLEPSSKNRLQEILIEVNNLCKSNLKTFIFTSHMVKDGKFAGPKIFEHISDLVIHLNRDQDDNFNYKMLKDRYRQELSN